VTHPDSRVVHPRRALFTRINSGDGRGWVHGLLHGRDIAHAQRQELAFAGT
jgi:hypothetical protein